MNHGSLILTNFHKDNIKIIISCRCSIVLEHLPEWLSSSDILIKVIDSNGNSVFKDYLKVQLPYEFKLPYLNDGIYTLHLFYKSKLCCSKYIGLNSSQGFPILVRMGTICTVLAKTFENNKNIYIKLNEQFIKNHNSSIVATNRFIPNDIIALARKITRFSFSNYDKILAVHDWIASNIYYDYDSLSNNSYKQQKNDALSVVNRKRTVCSGFSELAVSLLCAVGVAAVNMDCFALGGTCNGDWETPSNMEDEANHVVTFAYADDRWLMMDVTWDSDNEYKNGTFGKKTGYGVSHQYFDCTLSFFSYTHRFIKKI